MVPRQRTAGTAGIVSAVGLVAVLALILSSGLTPEVLSDPAKALPYITQNPARWSAPSIIGAIVAGVAVLFVAGLANRLRERTPTRATAVLYLGLLGIAGHGFESIIRWVPSLQVAAYAGKDQVAAAHAWVALSAIQTGLGGIGNAFFGAAALVAGWAIISGRALPSTVGWVGVVAGLVDILAVFAPASPLFLLTIVLDLVWLAWTGNALRRTAAAGT